MVEQLCPHFLAIVLADLRQLLRQADLGLLHPKVIGCLLRSLRYFLGRPSSLLGFLQFCLQFQDLLFGRGQLYLSVMEPFALLLNLVLGILQVGLSALLPSLPSGQLCNKLLILLLHYVQGLAGLDAKVDLDPSLVSGIFHPFLGCEHLLDGLHKNDRQARY